MATAVKRLVLDVASMEDDFFESSTLIGMVTAMPGYQLCWTLNRTFGLSFVREHEMDITPNEEQYFPLYYYPRPLSMDRDLLYRLKHGKTALLPDLKNLDYLWLVQCSMHETLAAEYLTHLRAMPEIQLAQIIRLDQIRHPMSLLL